MPPPSPRHRVPSSETARRTALPRMSALVASRACGRLHRPPLAAGRTGRSRWAAQAPPARTAEMRRPSVLAHAARRALRQTGKAAGAGAQGRTAGVSQSVPLTARSKAHGASRCGSPAQTLLASGLGSRSSLCRKSPTCGPRRGHGAGRTAAAWPPTMAVARTRRGGGTRRLPGSLLPRRVRLLPSTATWSVSAPAGARHRHPRCGKGAWRRLPPRGPLRAVCST